MATVLVVDDEPDLREVLRLNLALDGHRVVLAGDGDEALELVRQVAPDLILLDVIMPVRDGWEVLGTIKAGGHPQAATPVVLLTARTSELDQVRGAIEGAIDYITKPFSVAVLRRAVNEALTGDPEPVKRRRIQRDALRRLARLERGDPGPPRDQAEATPRLTRLESSAPLARRTRLRPADAVGVANLSEKQQQLLVAVSETGTVREAADRLGVSRSYVYASLRRMARKVGVRSGPELVRLARQGSFATRE